MLSETPDVVVWIRFVWASNRTWEHKTSKPITICVQDGHPADQRPVHDFQRLWGWKYEQAGIRLLLEWLDQEGVFHPSYYHYQSKSQQL